jgi:serine/threonine protein kinase
VAWNQVKLRNVDEKERSTLMQEVKTLRMLKHQNIIRFFDSWTHEKDKSASLTINFITELCNHTLRKCVPRRRLPANAHTPRACRRENQKSAQGLRLSDASPRAAPPPPACQLHQGAQEG